MTEIWQRYSTSMQLAFLDFVAVFDSPHRGRILNELHIDGVPGKCFCILDDISQRTTATIRAPVVCQRCRSTTPFDVVIEPMGYRSPCSTRFEEFGRLNQENPPGQKRKF
ncbi:hypothetical protein RB195_008523 [Necator americanus]|uniref:Reverse transcriptase domain-containing protein n=1 Tax=Necator americanus TaxID=51031 RepID=A0ABR1CP24_NECAM